MITRDDFKLVAYGQYAFSRRCESIAKKDMDLFVEGAMFAFDFVAKAQSKARLGLEPQIIETQIEKPLAQN